MLQCENLVCGYGKNPRDNSILTDVSFTIKEGKSLAILGANGSGKTTLLRALSGTLPYEGSIKLLGSEIRSMDRREIASMQAMLSQLSQVYFSYTVEETVMLGRYLYNKGLFGKPGKRDKEVVDRCLRQNGLYNIKDKQILELSGGQRQRVFLARTIAQETPLLLLDEPTNHLDMKYQEELMDYLKEWSSGKTVLQDGREVHNTLVGVFHDINMAINLCENMMLVKDGKILAKGTKDEVATDANLHDAYGMDVASYMKKMMSFWT